MKTLALILSLLVGGAALAQPRGAHSPGGWEIYSWRVGGRWYFSLVEGARREKSLEEITGKKMEAAELEQKLTLLQIGEQLAWGTGDHVRTRAKVFATPPDPIRDRIVERCLRLGLKLGE
jgi:hypothetical protein